MSGVTLAVGPRSDPDRTTSTPDAKGQPKTLPNQQQGGKVGGVMGSLRIIELQLVAFIMVFSASGLVPLLDVAYPIFTTVYLMGLAQFAFPSHRAASTATSNGASREIFQGSGMFRLYVILGTTVGLFLPLAYVLGGFARGDEHAVRSATPHLFLLSCQILTENFISGLSLFSPPVRAMVPLLYTVRRIFVVIDWITDVWINKALPANADIRDVAWFWFGRVLAVANCVYFSINLFCFLIPRFLPRAFERYFVMRDEIHSKMEEDRRSGSALGKKKDEQAAGKKDE